MSSRKPAKHVAVVLSGGGAYAAYEIGAMRAILGGETLATSYSALYPGIYAGTSAGAMNAALMVAHFAVPPLRALDQVEKVWVSEFAGQSAVTRNGVMHVRFNPFSLASLSDIGSHPLRPLKELSDDVLATSQTLMRHGAEFALSTASLGSRALELMDMASMISTEPLKLTLKRVLDLGAIRQSNLSLTIAATNWTTGELRTFGNGDFVGEQGYGAVLASTAIPGIFAPVALKDANYVDGGLVMNSPLSPAIESGASEIHIIYLDPEVRNIPSMKLQSTMDMFERSLAISFANRANQDIENARWINEGLAALSPDAPKTPHGRKAIVRTISRIKGRSDTSEPYRPLTIHRYHPNEDLGNGIGILDFSRDAIRKTIDRGYQDTIRHDCGRSQCILPE